MLYHIPDTQGHILYPVHFTMKCVYTCMYVLYILYTTGYRIPGSALGSPNFGARDDAGQLYLAHNLERGRAVTGRPLGPL